MAADVGHKSGQGSGSEMFVDCGMRNRELGEMYRLINYSPE